MLIRPNFSQTRPFENKSFPLAFETTQSCHCHTWRRALLPLHGGRCRCFGRHYYSSFAYIGLKETHGKFLSFCIYACAVFAAFIHLRPSHSASSATAASCLVRNQTFELVIGQQIFLNGSILGLSICPFRASPKGMFYPCPTFSQLTDLTFLLKGY